MLIKDEDGNTRGEITRAYQAGYVVNGDIHKLVVYHLAEDGNIACTLDYDVVFALLGKDYPYGVIGSAMYDAILKIHNALLDGDDSVTLPIKKA